LLRRVSGADQIQTALREIGIDPISPANSQSMMRRSSNMKPMTSILVPAAVNFIGRFRSPQTRVMLATVAATVTLGLVLSAADANAYTCGRNAFGAGCIGPRGAVGINRHGAVVVGRYGNVYAYHRGSACYWHNNQRICP
jgi:hypothetical protein